MDCSTPGLPAHHLLEFPSSWNPNTLASWCEELTHWKRPWGWERLKAGGDGDDRGWDGWMASLTWWTWVCASSGSWWWTGRPGVLQSMVSQTVRHNWATKLTDVHWISECNPATLYFVALFFCPQSFPASGSFPGSFSFSISPSYEYSGLISFRTDWFDPLAVQGTLKSLLQHHNWKESILRCSAFFMFQLSHPYMTTGKIIALTVFFAKATL